MPTSQKRVVIIGGGAGGLELAVRLSKKMGKDPDFNLTLVDKNLVYIWKPLLHELAAGTLKTDEQGLSYIAYSAKRKINFYLGSLQKLDRKRKEVTIATHLSANHHPVTYVKQIPYDILIIAIGSITNDFNIPGAREHCYFLDSVADANNFQQAFLNKIIQNTQYATENTEPFKLAIIGAGATGVELAAELHKAYAIALKFRSTINPQPPKLQITLIEAAPRILENLPEKLSRVTRDKLNKLGINILTEQSVVKVVSDGLLTQNNTFIKADLMVWTAGIKAPEILKHLDGLETNRSQQLCVLPTLQTTLDPNIFAFGDCAACPQTGGRFTQVPARAQAAQQQAQHLAKQIINFLNDKSIKPFIYHDRGSLVALSRYYAVGELHFNPLISNVFLQGLLAQFFYWSLYKMHQATLYGWWNVCAITFANLLTGNTERRLKLH